MGPLIAAVPAALPYIGAAFAGGSALSNMSKGGGSSSQAQGQSSELANEMARISRDLYNQTNPMRENIIGRGMDFLGVPQGGQQARPPQQIQLPMTLTEKIKQHGQTITIPGVQGGMEDQAQGGNPFSVDPSASPLYAPGKYALERQFQGAEEGIIPRTQRLLERTPIVGRPFEKLRRGVPIEGLIPEKNRRILADLLRGSAITTGTNEE